MSIFTQMPAEQSTKQTVNSGTEAHQKCHDVPPRMTVLRPETLLNTINIAQAGETRLQIQLRALRQERRLAIVVELEQRGAALDLRLHHAWRCYFYYAVFIEDLSECA